MAALARFASIALLVTASPLVAACSGTGALPDAYVSESEPLRRTTPSTAPYSFFLVTRAPSGAYLASELASSFTVCLDGAVRAACPFGELDLGQLGLAPADVASITGDVGADAREATLVFVGTFARRASLRASAVALEVQEVWRAPVAGSVRAYDSWYHVSHDATQALVVNRWQSRTVSALDLASAPLMSDCDPDASGKIVCAPAQDGVREDAATPAGILVDGWIGQGNTLHVRQYFAKIAVGAAHAPNGYWYCRADQVACDNGRCADTVDVCTHEGFHGGGLKTVYTRTPADAVQPWLVSTSQLTPAESAALGGSTPAP